MSTSLGERPGETGREQPGTAPQADSTGERCGRTCGRQACPVFGQVVDGQGGKHDSQVGFDGVPLVVADRPGLQVMLDVPVPCPLAKHSPRSMLLPANRHSVSQARSDHGRASPGSPAQTRHPPPT